MAGAGHSWVTPSPSCTPSSREDTRQRASGPVEPAIPGTRQQRIPFLQEIEKDRARVAQLRATGNRGRGVAGLGHAPRRIAPHPSLRDARVPRLVGRHPTPGWLPPPPRDLRTPAPPLDPHPYCRALLASRTARPHRQRPFPRYWPQPRNTRKESRPPTVGRPGRRFRFTATKRLRIRRNRAAPGRLGAGPRGCRHNRGCRRGRGRGSPGQAPGKSQPPGQGRPCIDRPPADRHPVDRHRRCRRIQRSKEGSRRTVGPGGITISTGAGGEYHGQSRGTGQQTTETGTHNRRHPTCSGGRLQSLPHSVPHRTISCADANASSSRHRTRGELHDARKDSCRTGVPEPVSAIRKSMIEPF